MQEQKREGENNTEADNRRLNNAEAENGSGKQCRNRN